MYKKKPIWGLQTIGKPSIDVEELQGVEVLRELIVVEKDEEKLEQTLNEIFKEGNGGHINLNEERGTSNHTLMYWAAYLEQPRAISLLSKFGATPSWEELQAALSGKYGERIPECLVLVLQGLLKEGETDLMDALNHKENDWDGAALHIALTITPNKITDEEKFREIIGQLLKCPGIDLLLSFRKGITALHYCCKEGWKVLVGDILERAALIDSKKIIKEKKEEKLVYKLLHARSESGKTPLDFAYTTSTRLREQHSQKKKAKEIEKGYKSSEEEIKGVRKVSEAEALVSLLQGLEAPSSGGAKEDNKDNKEDRRRSLPGWGGSFRKKKHIKKKEKTSTAHAAEARKIHNSKGEIVDGGESSSSSGAAKAEMRKANSSKRFSLRWFPTTKEEKDVREIKKKEEEEQLGCKNCVRLFEKMEEERRLLGEDLKRLKMIQGEAAAANKEHSALPLNIPESEVKRLEPIGKNTFKAQWILVSKDDDDDDDDDDGRDKELMDESLLQMEVAEKVLAVGTDGRTQQTFFTEANIVWQTPSHANVLQLYGIVSRTHSGELSMITDYCPRGSVESCINRNDWNQVMSVGDVVAAAHSLAQALVHLHRHNIVHNGVTTRNVLIKAGEKRQVLLGDMSLSRVVDVSSSISSSISPSLLHQTLSAIPPNRKDLAPERYFGRYGPSSDVWSFGFVLYAMLTGGNLPFPSGIHTEAQVQQYIRTDNLVPRVAVELLSILPSSLTSLFEKCWKQRPEDRIHSDKLVEILTTTLTILPKLLSMMSIDSLLQKATELNDNVDKISSSSSSLSSTTISTVTFTSSSSEPTLPSTSDNLLLKPNNSSKWNKRKSASARSPTFMRVGEAREKRGVLNDRGSEKKNIKEKRKVEKINKKTNLSKSTAAVLIGREREENKSEVVMKTNLSSSNAMRVISGKDKTTSKINRLLDQPLWG